MAEILAILSNPAYAALISTGATLLLTALHARGKSLPILETLLDWVIAAEGGGKAPAPVAPVAPATPAGPAAPLSAHPIIDLLNSILGGALQGRTVTGHSSALSTDGNTLTATVNLAPAAPAK